MHRLPFEGRTGLWVAPMLVLLVVEGAMAPARLLAGRRWPAAPTVLGLAAGLLCVLPSWISPPPWTAQNIRPVLMELTARSEAGDEIYAFYGAGQAFAWYGPRLGLEAWGGFTQGTCHRGDVRGYFHEVDAFRGGSVWVVFTHVREFFDEVDPLLAYLRAIGVQTAEIADPDGNVGGEAAFAYRFDLSDPERLSAASAESFEFSSRFEGTPSEACTGPAANF